MASLHDSSFYCITNNELPQDAEGSRTNFRDVYVDVSVSFACLGAFGAIWQLLSWKMIEKQNSGSERRRTTISPVIAVSLAVSNFLTCIGIVARATGILLTPPPNVTCTGHGDPTSLLSNCTSHVRPTVTNSTIIIGTAVEVFTNFMYAASAMWTVAYAVDVYSRIRRWESESYVMPRTWLYVLFCWGVPAFTTAGAMLVIWIKTDFPGICADRHRLLWRYLFSYIPVLLGFLVNPVIFWRAHSLSKMLSRRTGRYSSAEQDVMGMLKVKFLIIVGAYTACWLPNIVGSIVQLAVMSSSNMALWNSRYKVLLPFWFVEAILNPLQGLFNCFLYRKGLFACFYNRARGDKSIQTSVEEDESRLLLRGNHPSTRKKYYVVT